MRMICAKSGITDRRLLYRRQIGGKMHFPREFFYDEVKDGFYISGIMKSVRAAQMEVLDQIRIICNRHNIQWFADCGTLLGTVRHGGYIPWDDDLDICMLRDDYSRFLSYADKELPEEYLVRTHENGELWQIKSHIVNRKMLKVDDKKINETHGCPFCTGVDVFVLDYLAPDPQEEEVRKKLIQSLLAIADNGTGEDGFSEDVLELLKLAEETCGVKLDHSNHLRRQIYGLAERLASLYPSEGAKEVALMPFWSYYNTHRYPIECVNRVTQLPFENTMINVPAGYDEVLRIEYGDYLRINRKGGMHDYPIFQNQVLDFSNLAGIPDLFEYIFQKEDLKKEKEKPALNLKQRALDLSEILLKVRKIMQIMSEQSGPEEIISILENCQESAIQVGTEIEKEYGEGFVVVKHLEDCCEILYNLTQSLLDDASDISEPLELLEICRNQLRECIEHEMTGRKKVLFLPFSGRFWESLAPLYQREKALPDQNVYIMPVPYYDRDFLGKLGDLHFETDGYPTDVKFLDYRAFSIRDYHPDVIYTQYPYDVFHFSYTVPSEYYTSELKKYTEELIYVPYFRIGDFDFEDEKLRQTTRYFVKIPGLMHADKVLVESGKMRSLYIQELVDFCGRETQEMWEEKIISLEEICPESIDAPALPVIPEEWEHILYREVGTKKKTVLYQITVSSLYRFQEKMILKIREALKMFQENRGEVALIFRPHPSIAASMDLFQRDVWLEYRKLIEEYRSGGWGILDENEDAAVSAAVSDAYYGDGDVLIQRFREKGKPVMIENVEIL